MAQCIGCGLHVTDGKLAVQMRPGGGLGCDPDGGDAGLYVNFTPISTTDCNALVLSNGGYYVPCQDGIAGTSIVQLSPQGGAVDQELLDGGNYGYLNHNSFDGVHFCNPTCCTIGGLVVVKAGDVYLQAKPGFIGSAKLEVNINNVGFTATEPNAVTTFTNNGGVDSFAAIDLDAHLYIALAPGACVDYQWNLLFQINTSGGSVGNRSHIRTNGVGPRFVTRWVGVQVDCCDHRN